MTNQNRRDFFKTFSNLLNPKKESLLIRPPYTLDSFSECLNCEGNCKDVCEESIIKIDENKSPYLDFSQSGCTFCKECANACSNEVLSLNNPHTIKAKVEIDSTTCLSWHSTMCFSCKDSCIYNSIKFLGLFRPEIKKSCVGCGFCISICPVDAISIRSEV